MSTDDFRPATLIELHAVEAVPIPGRGLLHIVAGNSGIAEPDDLSGQDVLLDGALIRVAAVETFAVARPYPEHLSFGLLVAS
jgi:hypothetical protein